MHVQPRYAGAVRASTLRRAAQAALDAARVRRKVALTIVVAGDAALRRLNRDFLGVDAPTDVLSFPTGGRLDGSPRPIGSGREYLGDVIISLARAKAQAKIGGHALDDELRLLVIHGVLHLLGLDHGTVEDKRRMWSLQAKALKKAGAWIAGPAE